jgi:hypothetical protein
MKHPAMFGIGAGIEQNTHRICENVDARHVKSPRTCLCSAHGTETERHPDRGSKPVEASGVQPTELVDPADADVNETP